MATTALPAVAICIPTYNQADYLRRAVDSAYGQDYDGPLEVWVGDDASTDNTPEVLEELRARYPALRAIRQEANLGIAGNTSALLAAPDAPLVVRLDSDDELTPSFVSRLVPLVSANPDAGYGHTAIVEVDAGGREGRLRRLLRGTGHQDGETALRASLSGYRTVANILMFRREALEELDFYRGRPEFVEDYDLAVRMAAAGHGNVYLDEPLARYRVWEDAAGTRSRRKGLQLRGYARIFDEAFEPAWRERGWSLRPVRRQRRWLAVHHCNHCFGPQYSPAERAELIGMLRRLGDGPRLRLRLALCRMGLAPAIDRVGRLRDRSKATAKAAIRRSGLGGSR